ncbi:MAG: hypothetical protein QXD86_04975 [Candidatus Bathyarchaeia archaeon]
MFLLWLRAREVRAAGYKVTIMVRKVRGRCPLYKVGDRIVVEKFYINPKRSGAVRMRAFAAISIISFLPWCVGRGAQYRL